MKKNVCKALAAFSAAALLAGIMPMAALADKVAVTGVDTFDTYTAVAQPESFGQGPLTGYTDGNTNIDAGDVVLAVDEDMGDPIWTAPQNVSGANFGQWQKATAAIIADPTADEGENNQVLAMEGPALWNTYTATPRIRYDYATMNANTEYIYEFDMYTDNSNVGRGLRFNMTDGDYYELMFDGGNASHSNGSRTNILKCVDGTVTILDSNVEMGEAVVGSQWINNKQLQSGKWLNVALTVSKGSISWVVKFGDNGEERDGAIYQTGSCADVDPIDASGMQVALITRGQGNQWLYYDNFSISKNVELEDDGSFSAFGATTETVERDGETLVGVMASTEEDVKLAGRWYIKQSKDGQAAGYDGNAIYAISTDPAEGGTRGNNLMIESRAAVNAPNAFPMAYNNKMISQKGQNYLYQYDINFQAGGGIRFNYTGEGATASYYELLFTNGHDTTAKDGTILSKTVNGERTVLAADTATYVSMGGTYWTDSNTLQPNMWHAVKLYVLDGVISWEVYNAAGALLQTGSYDDSAAYLAGSDMQTLFLGACQGKNYTYFDNVSMTVIPADKGDFNNYAVTADVKADQYAEKKLAGPWTIKQDKTGQRTGATFAIAADPLNSGRGNTLRIESYNVHTTPDTFSMAYNANWKITEDGKYIYKFDFQRDDGTSGGGIRFNYSGSYTGEGGDANYYELFFNRGNGVQLAKCVDGIYTVLEPTVNQNESTGWTYWSGQKALRPDVWYEIELIVDNGNISWNANDKTAAIWWQSGSYTDEDPLSAANTQPAFFAAGQNLCYAYFDNASIQAIVDDNGTFEKQDATGDVYASQGADTRLSGNWFIRGDYTNEKAGYDGKAVYAIQQNPNGTGKVLKLEARAAYGLDGDGMVPTFYNETWKTDSAEKTMYAFDFYKSNIQPGPVIRFNYSKASTTDVTYYQLSLKGSNGSNTTTLSKVTNGIAKGGLVDLDATITGEQELKELNWYTLCLTAEGGNISWIVTDKETGAEVQSGSYTDADPIEGTDLMTMIGAQGQGTQYVYFDNVTCTTGDDIIEDYAITGYADGSATIEAPIANTTATVVFAAYAEGQLTSVSYQAANLARGENTVSPAETFSAEGADQVVVMLWDGMDPICGAYPYTIG